jgi:PTS system sucrose-specific IIC component
MKIKDNNKVNVTALKAIDGVMGVVEDETLQVVVGPGKAKKLCDIVVAEYSISRDEQVLGDWQSNKSAVKEKFGKGSLKAGLKLISNIFMPLLPAIIAGGILNGLSGLISNLTKTGTISPDNVFWATTNQFMGMLGGAFFAYMVIYVGINAAKQFGATPALGGMIGAMSIATQVNTIADTLGLYNPDSPLDSILRSGKGGIIGVIFGVWLLSKVESWVRKRVPDTLDMILTPLISLIVVAAVMLFVLMPVSGLLSTGIVAFMGILIESSNPVVSAISGFILAATFLPMVLLGLHHGLIPFYFVQLEATGAVTLFPILVMAGAGQVGAAISILLRAKKLGYKKLQETILGALPAGFLGVGEPLIYGVTLPLGKPFISAGIGAGIAGAAVAVMKVTAHSFGPSGLTGIPLMQPDSILPFIIGLVIAYISGFLVTQFMVTDEDLKKAL